MKATKRSYEQWCAVARALDLVGERWTMLIVRDLLVGPKRYTDLLGGLPGIGTNLLAERLRELESEGIVERAVLPPPAAATVYRLTEAGLALEPAVLALGRWGFRFLGRPRPGEAFLPDPFFLSLRASFRPEAARGRRESYGFEVAGRAYEVRVDDGTCRITQGTAADPVAVISSDAATLFALRRRDVSPARALSSGKVRIAGDRGALERFIDVFGWSKEAFAGPRA